MPKPIIEPQYGSTYLNAEDTGIAVEMQPGGPMT